MNDEQRKLYDQDITEILRSFPPEETNSVCILAREEIKLLRALLAERGRELTEAKGAVRLAAKMINKLDRVARAWRQAVSDEVEACLRYRKTWVGRNADTAHLWAKQAEGAKGVLKRQREILATPSQEGTTTE